MQTRSIRSLIYLGGGIGFILAVFAALEVVYSGLSKVCSFNGFFSCATVLKSGSTTFLHVPDWAWGVAGFIAILVVAALAERWPNDPRWCYGLVVLTSAGIGLALYLLYVELAVIGAVCLVCASSYAMGFVCWGGAISLAQRTREIDRSHADEP